MLLCLVATADTDKASAERPSNGRGILSEKRQSRQRARCARPNDSLHTEACTVITALWLGSFALVDNLSTSSFFSSFPCELSHLCDCIPCKMQSMLSTGNQDKDSSLMLLMKRKCSALTASLSRARPPYIYIGQWRVRPRPQQLSPLESPAASSITLALSPSLSLFVPVGNLQASLCRQLVSGPGGVASSVFAQWVTATNYLAKCLCFLECQHAHCNAVFENGGHRVLSREALPLTWMVAIVSCRHTCRCCFPSWSGKSRAEKRYVVPGT